VSNWLVSREELTVEQVGSVELPMGENRLISGGPGSGKTLVLAHRARHFMDELGVAPERLRIFVYTRTLAAYIRDGLYELQIPDECISTFDSWCYELFREHVRGVNSWDPVEKRPRFDIVRAEVLKLFESGRLSTMFDVVLVDEAQDLPADAFKILRRAARHITICLDRKQRIYDEGVDDEEIRYLLGIKRTNISLLQTFRCSPYIVALAAAFLDEPEASRQFQKQTQTTQGDRETPVLYSCPDSDVERAKLIELVALRAQRGGRIGLLFPQRRQAWGYAKALREAGLHVEEGKEVDFETDAPKAMTIASAKGLTFDSVIVPRLSKAGFGPVDEEKIDRMLFMAATRATDWVAFMTSRDDLGLESRLAALAKDQKVRIDTGENRINTYRAPSSSGEESPMDLL
jgi:superfamily I DNA/RNA helicase